MSVAVVAAMAEAIIKKPMRTRAAAIVIHENQLLVLARVRDKHHFYVFPGGQVEESESIEAAAVRELFEETSVRARTIKPLYHLLVDSDSFLSDEYFYLCQYISGNPQFIGDAGEVSRQHTGEQFDAQWMPLDKLVDLALYPIQVRDWLVRDIQGDLL